MRIPILTSAVNEFRDGLEFKRQLRERELIEWQRVRRFMFVCTGNICRSPYGAEVARRLSIPSLSSGIDTHTNLPANASARSVAARRGVDLSGHLTTQWKDVVPADDLLIIAMESHHLRAVRAVAERAHAQVTLMSVWCTPPQVRIADPYGKDDAFFMRCFDQIDAGLQSLAASYRRQRAA
jgi:protein-tyrosine phosphatase